MDIRRPSSEASVIDIAGNFTAACEDVLIDAYSQATDRYTRAVVLNFSGLEYMNSGIGLLVTLLVRANCQRQRLLAFGLSEHYRRILALTRLDDSIGIYDDEDQALAAASIFESRLGPMAGTPVPVEMAAAKFNARPQTSSSAAKL
jgi:anti-sigma B factor antagonist